MKQSLKWALLISAMVFMACSHGDNSTPPGPSTSPLQVCQKKALIDSYNYGDKEAEQDVAPTDMAASGDTAWVVATAKAIPGIQKSMEHGLVRKTTNGGQTWSLIDDSTGPKQLGAENRAVALGSNNSIYVAQNYNDGSTTSANLHYSIDGEKTWKDASYSEPSFTKTQSRSVAVAPDNAVYMAVVSELNGKNKSSLLKLINGQFTVVDSLPNAEIKQIAVKKDGSILEVGSLLDDQGASTWLVRSGIYTDQKPAEPALVFSSLESNFPAALSNNDKVSLARTYTLTSQLAALSGSATAVYVDAHQTVFVAGVVSDGKTSSWTVQENSGGSFYVNDVYHYGIHKDVVPKVFFDYLGLTALVGGSHDTGGLGYWNVRVRNILPRPHPHGKWFELSSTRFSNSTDEGSQAVGAFTNSAGQVILVGDSKDDKGMRSLKALSLTPCPPPRH